MRISATCIVVLLLTCPRLAAIEICFDYRFDDVGYFDAEKRAALDLAADAMSRWLDSLSAVMPNPDAGETWSVFGVIGESARTIENLTLANNELRVFVGTQPVLGNKIATFDTGFVFINGSEEWRQSVLRRGQSGVASQPPTDYAPWGGFLNFNRSLDWHVSPTLAGGGGKYDFLSIALHELGHLMGIGPAASWQNLITNGAFVGARAVSESGLAVLNVDAGAGHWKDGTISSVAGHVSEASMTPVFEPGERRLFTDLDFAALDDIGWEPALPGDVDRNGRIDSFDLQQILAANSVANGVGYGWSAGDVDGDLDVDAFDLQAILATGLLNAGPYATTAQSALHTRLDELGSQGAPVVPEPRSSILASIVMVIGIAVRSVLGNRCGSVLTLPTKGTSRFRFVKVTWHRQISSPLQLRSASRGRSHEIFNS